MLSLLRLPWWTTLQIHFVILYKFSCCCQNIHEDDLILGRSCLQTSWMLQHLACVAIFLLWLKNILGLNRETCMVPVYTGAQTASKTHFMHSCAPSNHLGQMSGPDQLEFNFKPVWQTLFEFHCTWKLVTLIHSSDMVIECGPLILNFIWFIVQKDQNLKVLQHIRILSKSLVWARQHELLHVMSWSSWLEFIQFSPH